MRALVRDPRHLGRGHPSRRLPPTAQTCLRPPRRPIRTTPAHRTRRRARRTAAGTRRRGQLRIACHEIPDPRRCGTHGEAAARLWQWARAAGARPATGAAGLFANCLTQLEENNEYGDSYGQVSIFDFAGGVAASAFAASGVRSPGSARSCRIAGSSRGVRNRLAPG